MTILISRRIAALVFVVSLVYPANAAVMYSFPTATATPGGSPVSVLSPPLPTGQTELKRSVGGTGGTPPIINRPPPRPLHPIIPIYGDTSGGWKFDSDCPPGEACYKTKKGAKTMYLLVTGGTEGLEKRFPKPTPVPIPGDEKLKRRLVHLGAGAEDCDACYKSKKHATTLYHTVGFGHNLPRNLRVTLGPPDVRTKIHATDLYMKPQPTLVEGEAMKRRDDGSPEANPNVANVAGEEINPHGILVPRPPAVQYGHGGLSTPGHELTKFKATLLHRAKRTLAPQPTR